MHPNPAFRKEGRQRNIAFAREQAFGTLAVNAQNGEVDGPLLSHIPFLLSEDGTALEAHLVRSNPILKLLEEPQSAVISVVGSHGYVSPDWYGVDDQVPTWNYVAVHLRGTLTRLADDKLHHVLVRLSAEMEARLEPKKPWKIDKMDEDVYQRMLRQIVPIKMDVTEINGTWKLNQNKPDEVRHSAADHMEQNGFGAELGTLVSLMRSV